MHPSRSRFHPGVAFAAILEWQHAVNSQRFLGRTKQSRSEPFAAGFGCERHRRRSSASDRFVSDAENDGNNLTIKVLTIPPPPKPTIFELKIDY